MPERLLQSIHFHFVDVKGSLKHRIHLKKFLFQLAKKEGQTIKEIQYIFCNDAFLIKLNKDFLNHDTLTDIITFPFSQLNEPIVSEIYISLDRVRENALHFKTSFTEEIHRVMFHGLLHLCGYKDKSALDKSKMRAKEDEYLKKWFHVKH